MSEYFPELKPLGRRVKVELYLFNYATKMQQELTHHLLLKKLIELI